ncbi:MULTISPECIES: saccharopine dehydrogenase [Streptomyces]|uniref:saccharopine dehydrogenase n=1 Tax=Streptomyces TaxID=1883 RepID=UPI0003031383|nr:MULTISPECIES: saccharopine dehydrogenase [Streptomyces]MBP5860085.1 saccharopine dehydrogenase [Streptomyces sp. LBUM 1484]MBP5871068.1 saccharopine dehydrogenase [Streptomyces sp. LBUM 1485]MBP5908893.1 saccharopine dehydrogenase [Streptomyces sp. LBUM 1478]MBP5927513.1 saccharopine dehydrogenase [Streptomyces sp. LBUM 1479]KFG10748.1 saccharopine dehydrogenase [Streptomyces scabiei]
MTALHLWLRHETRTTERRTPIVPSDARLLTASGVRITVEESTRRIFPVAEYQEAGCEVAAPGSWVSAPADAVIVGLKELPDAPAELTHRHIFFGHAYKGQPGAEALLRRFAAGGGALLDLEYLVDEQGRRLAAFGFWAGYLGAALAVLHHRGALRAPLRPTSKEEMEAELRSSQGDLTALVIGALGRSGQGARAALGEAGVEPTCWDLAETRDLDRRALLAHDLMVNTVLTTSPVPPFLTDKDLDGPDRRLRTLSDVTVDVGSPLNVLPVYDTTTEWDHPVRRLREHPPLDLIAIDNLPSLLPREASTDFSAALRPQLSAFGTGGAWGRCLDRFRQVSAGPGLTER